MDLYRLHVFDIRLQKYPRCLGTRLAKVHDGLYDETYGVRLLRIQSGLKILSNI
jgi:hypothetical protein